MGADSSTSKGTPNRPGSTPGIYAFPASGPLRTELIKSAQENQKHATMGNARRAEPRFPVEGLPFSLKIEHPGGGIVNGEALLVDLSATGLCAIWPGYIHVGTSANLSITTKLDAIVECAGRVMWCKLLQARYHSLGIKLQARIDPRDFVEPHAWRSVASSTTEVQVAPLTGQVMYLQPNPILQDLLSMLLSESKLSVSFAATTGEVFDVIRTSGLDLLILETGADASECNTLAYTLRQQGFAGPILLLAPEGGIPEERESIESGITRILNRPLTADILLEVVRKLINDQSNTASGTSPIFSSLPDAGKRDAWIHRFVSGVRGRAQQIRQHANDGDVKETRDLCEVLASTGASYGFDMLTQTAMAAVKAIDASCSTEESMNEIRAVLRTIERLRAPNAVE